MFGRKRSRDDFAEEITAHLKLEADELKREGLTDEDARRQSRIEFGNVRVAQERFYLKDRVEWLDHWLRNVSFAIRQLVKNPGFGATGNFSAGSGNRRERGDLRVCRRGSHQATSLRRSPTTGPSDGKRTGRLSCEHIVPRL